MHDYHEVLPGYDPAQILHDGCVECEARAESRDCGISSLDHGNFERAWQRAAEWNTRGLANIASAEVPMLDALWAVQCKLQVYGISVGVLPQMAAETWLR